MNYGIAQRMKLAYQREFNPNDYLWLIQDIVGPYCKWPAFIKQVLNTRTFHYQERVKLLSFLFLNGIKDYMDAYNFLVRIKGVAVISEYFQTIKQLYLYWMHSDEGQYRRSRYFSKCLIHDIYEDLNNNPRNRNNENSH